MLTLMEIIDVIIMTIAVGVILSDFFVVKRSVDYYYRHYKFGIDFNAVKFAIIVTAPAIILHEFAHKFLALAFGATAVFHAAYIWLLIGLVIKMMNLGFVFFIPGYVSISGNISYLGRSLTAFAGPFMNLLLWISSALLLKTKFLIKRKKYIPFVYLTKKINMFLFIFNMLPIPPFDGFSFIYNLIKAIA